MSADPPAQVERLGSKTDSPREERRFEPSVPLARMSLDLSRREKGLRVGSGLSKRRHHPVIRPAVLVEFPRRDERIGSTIEPFTIASASAEAAAEGEMNRSFAAGVAILLSIGLPVVAAETPKRGGVLTYMIPADAPPSFDGHREATFATVHAVAPFYSV